MDRFIIRMVSFLVGCYFSFRLFHLLDIPVHLYRVFFSCLVCFFSQPLRRISFDVLNRKKRETVLQVVSGTSDRLNHGCGDKSHWSNECVSVCLFVALESTCTRPNAFVLRTARTHPNGATLTGNESKANQRQTRQRDEHVLWLWTHEKRTI